MAKNGLCYKLGARVVGRCRHSIVVVAMVYRPLWIFLVLLFLAARVNCLSLFNKLLNGL